MKVRTHYDNLKVVRDAPLEVIRAAYKALSQKYHPDKNHHANAPRIMEILNASYAILSDEKKRKEHDAWISKQELGPTQYTRPNQNSDGVKNEAQHATQKSAGNANEQKHKAEEDIYKKYYKKNASSSENNGSNDQSEWSKQNVNNNSYFKYSIMLFAILFSAGFIYSILSSAENKAKPDNLDLGNVANKSKINETYVNSVADAGVKEPYVKYVDGVGVLVAATSKSVELSDIEKNQSLDFLLEDKIYLNVKSTGENTAGVNLSVEWMSPAGDVVHSETRKIGVDNNHLNVFAAKSENDWPIGYYLVNVSLNEKVVKRLGFEINRRGLNSFNMIGPDGGIIKFPSGVTDKAVKRALDDLKKELLLSKASAVMPWEENYESDNPKSSSVECALNPHGEKWPSTSGYISGYRKLLTSGLSSVTLDNTQGGADAFIKLRLSNDSVTTDPIRAFFVKKGEKFTVKKINAGLYEIRYQDLTSCKAFKSENFELEEI